MLILKLIYADPRLIVRKCDFAQYIGTKKSAPADSDYLSEIYQNMHL
jgi:hypothetical protein